MLPIPHTPKQSSSSQKKYTRRKKGDHKTPRCGKNSGRIFDCFNAFSVRIFSLLSSINFPEGGWTLFCCVAQVTLLLLILLPCMGQQQPFGPLNERCTTDFLDINFMASALCRIISPTPPSPALLCRQTERDVGRVGKRGSHCHFFISTPEWSSVSSVHNVRGRRFFPFLPLCSQSPRPR